MNNVVPLTAKSQATYPEHLKEIGARINGLIKQYDDCRLHLAVELAQAKAVCKKAGVIFKSWVKEELRLSYPEAARLAKIGAADDPVKAIVDLRNNTKKSVKLRRDKNKSALRSALFTDARESYIDHLKQRNKHERIAEIYRLLDEINLSVMDFVKVLRLRK
ncbi:MAG: hypothetical protein FVQ79_12945 [Planctomycetes bacterium]|nr:hypothetical protein [Planctomycetota bacterium]